MASRSIPLRDLKAECAVMERSVLQGGAVSKEDLAPHRPGGPSNPDKTVRGWLRYFAVLHRKHALLMEHTLPDDTDAVLLSALRSEPLRVLLLAPPTEDQPAPTVAVHPKSFEALMEMQKHDQLIEWLALRYLHIHRHQQDHTDTEFLAFSQRALDELTYQYQLLAWIAVTPGPGLPYDPVGAAPVVPPHVRALDTLDLLSLVKAHVQVNATRLRALRVLLSPSKGGGTGPERPTWAMFFANAAVDLKTSTKALMRDHSLAEVLAMLQLHHVSARDALQHAKQETPT